MNEPEVDPTLEALNRAIKFAEAALHECDEQGFLLAAINLSSALDQLKAIRATLEQ